ncbi:hypothetical protein [Rhodococcus triatomae]|nr:hypothetical protein G419_24707 [Rhodococcus triatomae BKS 15-14]
MGSEVSVDVDGLDTLRWSPTGVTLRCALGCRVPGPSGSVDLTVDPTKYIVTELGIMASYVFGS